MMRDGALAFSTSRSPWVKQVVAHDVGRKGQLDAVHTFDLGQRAAVAGCIVDQDVQAAILFSELLHERTDGLLAGGVNVHHLDRRRVGEAGDLRGDLLAHAEVAAGEDHLCAKARQLDGDLLADAGGWGR